MMNIRKTPVSLALTAALSASIAAVPNLASAQQVPSRGGTGNVLVFPYYTANGGWSTLFNITNVSDDFLALKIRFREQENSRDVLDFNVVMSPEDVWTGWVAEGPNGPRFYTRDMSCTSPILPTDGSGAAYADFQDAAFTGASNDGGSTTIDRAREGHLEVFVMGRVDESDVTEEGNPTAYWADHKHLDCSIVDANFKVNTGSGPSAVEPSEDDNWQTRPQTALAGNPRAREDFDGNSCREDGPLKGNISFINTGRGVGAGSTALHIEGFASQCFLPSDDDPTNLVTAQEYPYFLEPTLASNDGIWGWNFLEFGYSSLFNEWSVNENTGASTDWIIAFPDKYLHVDIYDDLQAGVNLVRLAYAFGDGYCESVVGGYQCNSQETSPTLAGALANSGDDLEIVLHPFTEPFDGQSCDEVVYDLWDREENGVRGSGTSISPAPPVPASSLCYETNVITFGGADSVLDSRLAQTIDVSGLTSGSSFGWMKVGFDVDMPINGCNGASGTSEVVARAPISCQYGMPVVGFALKERDFGDPNKNYGQLMDHGYEQPMLGHGG